MTPEAVFSERWLWLAASLCIATLAIAIQWVLERPRFNVQAVPAQAPALYESMWIVRSLRLLYAVGIPALALFWRGALTSTGMGLKPFFWADNHAFDGNPVSWADWLHDIGWACLVALGLWLMVTIGEYNAKRLTVQRNTRRHNLGFAIREAVYHQIHWAFYREPFVLLWGIGIGAWAGLAPVAAEALVNPARWSDAQSPARGRDLLIRVGLAVMSAILYIETQNIWVILIADALLVWVLGHTPERTPRP